MLVILLKQKRYNAPASIKKNKGMKSPTLQMRELLMVNWETTMMCGTKRRQNKVKGEVHVPRGSTLMKLIS